MPIVRVILAMLFVAALCAPTTGQARAAHARIARVVSPIGVMQQARIDLDWPEAAASGSMRLRAASVDAPDLGYRFASLDWRCTLRRSGWSRWTCAGPLQTAQGAMALSVDINEHGLRAGLTRGASRIEIEHRGDAPDLTRLDLTAIPLSWMRVLLSRAWPDAKLKSGNGDARLRVTATPGTVRIAGPMTLRSVSLDTPDGTIAAEGLGGAFDLDMSLGDTDRVRLRGALHGGEILFGTTYLALAGRNVDLDIDAIQSGACCWRIPAFAWRDGRAMQASGSAAFGPDASIRSLEADIRSDDLAQARDVYLSGWLGSAGLADLELHGGLQAHVALDGGVLRAARANVAAVDLRDPKGRFVFDGLDGDVRYSSSEPVSSELRWRSGRLYGLDFGAARIPLNSAGGALRVDQPVDVPMLGGRLRFDHLAIRPATAGQPTEGDFGLDVQNLDVGQIAKTLGLPAFTGQLSGSIPNARYRNQRLDFDGGLALQLFGGRMDVSALSMERPFGVAPTLSADIRFDDLDLESLTGVLGFGSITGKLDGHINGLRLVDWQPEAFDASLRTDRHRGVRQRISQRAVQDISSVGGSTLVSGLQSRVIGLFKDFAYSALGIDCRLADEVCEMGGLDLRGPNSFTIVRGGGIPWLTVVGINRRVNWPTLVERLVAVGKGETKAVVK